MTTSQTTVQALSYRDPETIDTPSHVWAKADAWSFGAMMHQLIRWGRSMAAGCALFAPFWQLTSPPRPLSLRRTRSLLLLPIK